MNKVGNIYFKKINRISPSQFYSMKNCAYKSLLAEAFDKKPLLPVSANAYFGTVLHTMLELIAKRVIKKEDDFNNMFDEQVKLQEENLNRQGYNFFVPLQKNVKDFGMKNVLLKKHFINISDKPAISSGVNYFSEKWFESKDKLIAGKIDLVIEGDHQAEIIDFKTGAITQDVLDDEGEIFSDIKEEYQQQLKLYAYLYFETRGKFPTNLSLVNLARQKHDIKFSEQECHNVFLEAKRLLQTTNESIDGESFNANPSKENCSFCLYRPACSFFLKYLQTDYSFNDISGRLINLAKYQNGNVSIFLENEGKKFTVIRISSDKYNDLKSALNKHITIFNLRRESAEFVYSATKTTMIYE